MIERLNEFLDRLMNGKLNLVLTAENITLVSQEAQRLLSIKEQWTKADIDICKQILSISNIVYNNSDRELLFLDDGIYDLLLEVYKQYESIFQVGSPIVKFDNNGELVNGEKELINPIIGLSKDFIDNSLYYEDIFVKQPRFDIDYYNRLEGQRDSGIRQAKKNISVPHKYPNLVGSLDKCKFVLNDQARLAGVLDDPSVKIFERDFLGKQLQEGLLDNRMYIQLIAELKYDGVSVEADVTNKILGARSRGDVNNDIAADLTPVLGGMVFPFCPPMDDNEAFGMQFEAIMTYHNLERYSRYRGRPYKNSRNTMTGLLGSLDAYDFRDLITLVPLKTSLDIDPVQEIEFMNKYYQNGELLRYSVLAGNYYEVLFQVKKFVEEAEKMRPAFPFMYDGVVIHHTDPNIIQKLGRKNSINQYSIAIKFAPLKSKAIFTGYSYTVGQNGVVTPMIHYTPVEFYGTIHDKSSGHSYARFKDLNLAIGNVVDVDYRNDVMPYVTKGDQPFINPNQPEEFPRFCPSCGNELIYSDKQAVCNNPDCIEKVTSRMTNMLQKLGVKDFAEASIKVLGVTSFKEFMELSYEQLIQLGPTNAKNLYDSIQNIKTTPIEDYKLLGSIGFENIAVETWKKILSIIPYKDIMDDIDINLYDRLVNINGIGPSIAGAILAQRDMHPTYEDMEYIFHMPNIIFTTGIVDNKLKIRFSGIRDRELENKLNNLGYDASDGSVTKDVELLVVPYEGYTSDKVNKAIKYGIAIVQIDHVMDYLEQGR